ncbi:MAG: sigma-70 family RNA polymerase sigma factor [Pseudorhodoferax sp.]
MPTASPEHPLAQTWYQAHHGWLEGRLRRRIGCAFDAADLAQSTFVRVLTAPGLAQVEEPRAWLTTVAQNLLVNLVRRRAIEQACIDALAALPEEHAPSPEQRCMLLETLVDIDRRLDGLPIQAKQAFLLAQLDGLTQEAIAAELGISLSTVKRHLHKAALRCFFAR